MPNTFSSGPKTEKPRSDLRVTYTPGEETLTITAESKTGVLFRSSIHEQAKEICDYFHVTTGDLTIADFGAVPFVIAARIEATLEKAFPRLSGEYLPAMAAHAEYATRRDRLRRSRLYLPGNQPKLMLNAGIHKPDGLILDLEDSVAPDEKNDARFIVRNALRVLDFMGAERMVRINQGEQGREDLSYIVPHNVHTILVPKVESGEEIKMLDEEIAAIVKESGRRTPVYLMPIIESARGVLNAQVIADASPNNIALAIGLEDYTADIGVRRTQDGKESFFARSMIVNAARAAGIQAIDTVFSDVADEAGLRDSVREAKALGFDGKGCIHPRQIGPIHESFAPTREELEYARRIVQAYEEAEAKGLGVVALGSKMIDPPVVKRALQTLKLVNS
ncbi:MAG: aldolase/citrate lyase family protein [Fidelibacterota bacterium]